MWQFVFSNGFYFLIKIEKIEKIQKNASFSEIELFSKN